MIAEINEELIFYVDIELTDEQQKYLADPDDLDRDLIANCVGVDSDLSMSHFYSGTFGERTDAEFFVGTIRGILMSKGL